MISLKTVHLLHFLIKMNNKTYHTVGAEVLWLNCLSKHTEDNVSTKAVWIKCMILVSTFVSKWSSWKQILYFLQVSTENSCAIAAITYYDNSISSLTRLNKRYRKHKGQSIMDELETHATLGTRHRTKTNKKDEQHVPQQKNRGWTHVLAKSKQYDLNV